jgi:hypothetical protein
MPAGSDVKVLIRLYFRYGGQSGARPDLRKYRFLQQRAAKNTKKSLIVNC